jgi:hypothetical protein
MAELSKPGKTVYIKLGVWYNEKTGEIHLTGLDTGVKDFHTTVNNKSDIARCHRNLFRKLTTALELAGAPHPVIDEGDA